MRAFRFDADDSLLWHFVIRATMRLPSFNTTHKLTTYLLVLLKLLTPAIIGARYCAPPKKASGRERQLRADDGFISSYASQQVQLGIAAWTRFHSLSDDPCWNDGFDIAESWEQVDQSSTLSGAHRSYCVSKF